MIRLSVSQLSDFILYFAVEAKFTYFGYAHTWKCVFSPVRRGWCGRGMLIFSPPKYSYIFMGYYLRVAER